MPAVLSVTSDINVTRVPSMRDILAAGKKPVKALTGSDVKVPETAPIETVSVLAPAHTARKGIIIAGDSAENIAAFVKAVGPELN
jgi:electron transfer flavoprotein beta subunit